MWLKITQLVHSNPVLNPILIPQANVQISKRLKCNLFLLTNKNMKPNQKKKKKPSLFLLVWIYSITKKEGIIKWGLISFFPAVVWALFLFGRYFFLLEVWLMQSFLEAKNIQMDIFPSFTWWLGGRFGYSDAPTSDFSETKRYVAAPYVPSGPCNCSVVELSLPWDSHCFLFIFKSQLSVLPPIYVSYPLLLIFLTHISQSSFLLPSAKNPD